MSPLKRRVDAVRDDVWNIIVDTELEKVAVFARMDEIVREPAGFVMAAELSRNDVTCCP